MAVLQSNEIEQWKAIPGFEGLYEASSLGRVRSLRIRHGKTDKLRAVPRLLLGSWHRSGPKKPAYHEFQLSADGKIRHIAAQRLVLLAFTGLPPQCCEAAHVDGDSTNNRAANLEWKSPLENARDRIRHGTQARGNSCAQAKLTPEQIQEIRTSTEPAYKLALKFGVHPWTVGRARSGETWGWVKDVKP